MNANLFNSMIAHFINVSKSIEIENRATETGLRRLAYESCAKCFEQEINKAGPATILEVEQCILAHDLSASADRREANALKDGIRRTEEALSSLNNFHHYENFALFLRGCGLKNLDSAGLPRDGFRYAVADQIVYLKNSCRDDEPQYFRNFIKARTDVLKNAVKLYKSVQIKYMLIFSRDRPEHIMCKKFLSDRSNQKYFV